MGGENRMKLMGKIKELEWGVSPEIMKMQGAIYTALGGGSAFVLYGAGVVTITPEDQQLLLNLGHIAGFQGIIGAIFYGVGKYRGRKE